MASDISPNETYSFLSCTYQECYYLCFGLSKVQLDWKKARGLLESALEDDLKEIKASPEGALQKSGPILDIKGKMLLLLGFLYWQTTNDLAPLVLKASSDPRASFYLARYYLDTHKSAEAATCFQRAADALLHHPPSSVDSMELDDSDWTCYMLGFLSQLGQGLALDYVATVRWYRIAADHGHVIAQYNLGLLYQDGLGVIKDGKEAFRLMELASEQNYCHAQLHLGGFYETGNLTEVDLKKAILLYQKAADHGLTVAQVTLGHRYKEGVGCEKDLTKAAEWFQVAANKGSCRGQTALALCYEHGHGVPQDRDKALALYKLAAREREPIYLFNLAVCYKIGFGVESDLRKAAELYTLSIEEVRPGTREKLHFAKHNLSTIYQVIDFEMAEVVCTQYNIDEGTMFNLVDEKAEGEAAKEDSGDNFAKALALFIPLLESRTRTTREMPFVSRSLVNGCRDYYWVTYCRYLYLAYIPTLPPPPTLFSRLSDSLPSLPRRFSFPFSRGYHGSCLFARLPRPLIDYVLQFLTVKIKYQETPGLW